jgi:hypothetical protein
VKGERLAYEPTGFTYEPTRFTYEPDCLEKPESLSHEMRSEN